MALRIEKTIELFPGVNISQCYLRLEYHMDRFGKKLECGIITYPSREAYDEEKNNASIARQTQIKGIPTLLELPYDSNEDGVDILGVLHDKVKTRLSTDYTTEILVRDPSTGMPLLDPSTGERLTREVISVPKFAMDSSIFIVDMD